MIKNHQKNKKTMYYKNFQIIKLLIKKMMINKMDFNCIVKK